MHEGMIRKTVDGTDDFVGRHLARQRTIGSLACKDRLGFSGLEASSQWGKPVLSCERVASVVYTQGVLRQCYRMAVGDQGELAISEWSSKSRSRTWVHRASCLGTGPDSIGGPRERITEGGVDDSPRRIELAVLESDAQGLRVVMKGRTQKRELVRRRRGGGLEIAEGR